MLYTATVSKGSSSSSVNGGGGGGGGGGGMENGIGISLCIYSTMTIYTFIYEIK